MPEQRVAVLGLGLLGGSIARQLVRGGRVTVVGCDPDPETRHLAAAEGISMYDVPGDWLAGCELVVLATPLDVMESSLAAALPWLPEDAVVIDVGSVKEPVHEMVDRVGATGRFVGCHPMAGTEKAGFENAFPDLVTGVTWAVTLRGPDAPVDQAVWVIRFLVEHLDARVCVLPPHVHDSSVAVISHVPHLLANLLLDAAESAQFHDVAGHLAAGSFRDGTRVAGTYPLRTYNMIRENRGHVATELRRMLDRFEHLVGALESDDPTAVLEFLDGVQARAELVRSPVQEMIALRQVDAAMVRSLVGSPERAHLITASGS